MEEYDNKVSVSFLLRYRKDLYLKYDNKVSLVIKTSGTIPAVVLVIMLFLRAHLIFIA